MKPLLISLLVIMLLTFGFMIYNHIADTPGNGAVEKVEVMRVDAKHTLEQKKKEDDDDDDDDKKDDKEEKDKTDTTGDNEKKKEGVVDSVEVKEIKRGTQDSARSRPVERR